MTNIALDTYFEVEGFTVTEDALGSKVVSQFGDIVVSVELPTAPDSFKFGGVGSAGLVSGNLALTAADYDADQRQAEEPVALLRRGQFYEIRLVRAVADTERELSHASLIAARRTAPPT